MFDSLIPIIDYYNIKDTINNAGTFFAPTNNNIKKLLNIKTDSLRAQTEVEDTIYTLTHLFEDDTISSHIILQYAFNDRITLTNATQSGNEYISVKGDTIVIKKIQTTDNQYQEYNPEPVYFLNYSKEGFEDEVCQTADILTQNGSGTVLHVLNNVHTLGLFSIEEED